MYMMIQHCIEFQSVQELEISICDTCVHQCERTINDMVQEEVIVQRELVNHNKKENDRNACEVRQGIIVEQQIEVCVRFKGNESLELKVQSYVDGYVA